MEWLAQNWIWLVLFVGVMWLLSRGRHGGAMGGCCAHGVAHEGPAADGKARGADASPPPQANEQATGQAAARSPSAQHGGRGGCC